ncbi:hypothetical protein XENOCAPTIV_024383, partial [Xenoophorus captivus]
LMKQMTPTSITKVCVRECRYVHKLNASNLEKHRCLICSLIVISFDVFGLFSASSLKCRAKQLPKHKCDYGRHGISNISQQNLRRHKNETGCSAEGVATPGRAERD